jgi:hypothetical protein
VKFSVQTVWLYTDDEYTRARDKKREQEREKER